MVLSTTTYFSAVCFRMLLILHTDTVGRSFRESSQNVPSIVEDTFPQGIFQADIVLCWRCASHACPPPRAFALFAVNRKGKTGGKLRFDAAIIALLSYIPSVFLEFPQKLIKLRFDDRSRSVGPISSTCLDM